MMRCRVDCSPACGDLSLNILREVLKHDVFPALGCTEPIAVAYTASVAAKEVGGKLVEIQIVLDPGVYKNGFAVTIPNTNGERGNLIAGVLGAMIGRPELKMEIMGGVTEDILARAKTLIQAGQAHVSCDRSRSHLYIEVRLRTDKGTARAIVEGSHQNLVSLEKNDCQVFQSTETLDHGHDESFRTVLKKVRVAELVDLAEQIAQPDYDHVKQGIDMNLRVCEQGTNHTGANLRTTRERNSHVSPPLTARLKQKRAWRSYGESHESKSR